MNVDLRSLGFLALALGGLACQRERAPEPEARPAEALVATTQDWVTQDHAGRFTLRQVQAGSSCSLVASEGNAERWRSAGCVATREDLRFLSPDGDRLLVLYPLPVERGGNDWSELVVARAFLRGVEQKRLRGKELVAPGAIRDMSHAFSWVKGVGSQGGAAPRQVGVGIAVDLVDGATVLLGFDGAGAPSRPGPPPAEAAPSAPAKPGIAERDADDANEATLFRWEDQAGELHFSTWGEVPRQFRARARRVDAGVSSVATEKIKEDPAAQRSRATSLGSAPGRTDIHAGSKLNGLTDGERHEQEVARLKLESIQKMRDEELARERRRLEAEMFYRNSIERYGRY